MIFRRSPACLSALLAWALLLASVGAFLAPQNLGRLHASSCKECRGSPQPTASSLLGEVLHRPALVVRHMAAGEEEQGNSNVGGSQLPFWLDPTTRGGAVTVPIFTLVVPIGAYFALTASGMDGLKAGNYVTVSYVVLACVGWAGTYLFRVATKDMTYAQQLRDYEQAVIEKRFEELEDDEVDALLTAVAEEEEDEEAISFD